MSCIHRRRNGRTAHAPVPVPIVARQSAFSWVARRGPGVVLPFPGHANGSWSLG